MSAESQHANAGARQSRGVFVPFDGPSWPPLGLEIPGQPGPWVAENTTIIEGPGRDVKFGIEGRIVGADGGVTIHVFGGKLDEYLRFDCFEISPHYHYVVPDVSHTIVPYDVAASGPVLPWTIRAIGTRLGELLKRAGAVELASAIVDVDLRETVATVEEIASATAMTEW